MERALRTLAKTTTYGIMHLMITFFIALIVSRDLHVALGISLLEPFVQIIFFSLHEYMWNKTHPGTPSPHKNCCASSFAALPKAFALFRQKQS